MTHQRFPGRGPTTTGAAREPCAALRAGDHVFLRAQSGETLDGGFTGLGDPARQADQAMRNIRTLLEAAGARMDHIRKLTTHVTDRAWLDPVRGVIRAHLGALAPASVEIIVAGLPSPAMLVSIDAEAVVA